MQSALVTFVAFYGPYIGLILLIGIFAAFALERQPPVVIAVVGGLLMMALGFLPAGELLGVFSNSAPITIAAMFVLTGALLRTGALEEISGWVIRRTLRKPRLAIAEIGPDGSEMAVDAIIWCTGFRPALQHLHGVGVLEEDGRVLVSEQRSIKEPRLWLAGYGDWAGPGSATLMGAARTARDLAAALARVQEEVTPS